MIRRIFNFALSLRAEFIKFCAVGLIATLVSYGCFYIALEFFGVNYSLS
jgi:putative flippase GtrA